MSSRPPDTFPPSSSRDKARRTPSSSQPGTSQQPSSIGTRAATPQSQARTDTGLATPHSQARTDTGLATPHSQARTDTGLATPHSQARTDTGLATLQSEAHTDSRAATPHSQAMSSATTNSGWADDVNNTVAQPPDTLLGYEIVDATGMAEQDDENSSDNDDDALTPPLTPGPTTSSAVTAEKEKADTLKAIAIGIATFHPLYSRAYGSSFERVAVRQKRTNYVRCIRCKTSILRYATTGATGSSLCSHMKRCASASNTGQATLDAHVTVATQRQLDPNQGVFSMRRAVLDFFCVEGLPFDLVEAPSFRELLGQAMRVGAEHGRHVEEQAVASRRTLTVSILCAMSSESVCNCSVISNALPHTCERILSANSRLAVASRRWRATSTTGSGGTRT